MTKKAQSSQVLESRVLKFECNIKKKTTTEYNTNLKNHALELVFPKRCPLDAGIPYLWPQIPILRESSSLAPAGKV